MLLLPQVLFLWLTVSVSCYFVCVCMTISLVLCDHLEGWDRERGRETQEGGHMEIYVYV